MTGLPRVGASRRSGALAVLVLAAVLGIGCRPGIEGLKSLDLVPEGSSLFGGVDMTRLRTAPAVQRLQTPGRPFARLYPRLVRAAGLDPLRDIDRIRFGIPRSGTRGSFTVLTGRFEPKQAVMRMNEFRKEQGQPPLLTGRYRKHEVLAAPERTESAFAFTSADQLIGGPPSLVRLALQLLDRKGGVTGPSAQTVSAVLGDRTTPPHTVWLSLTVPAPGVDNAGPRRKRGGGPTGRRPAHAYRVTSARGHIDIGDGLQAELRFQLRDATEANLCARMLGLELGKLKDNPLVSLAGFREYLDLIGVQAAGTEMVVGVRYSAELLARLLALGERSMEGNFERRQQRGRKAGARGKGQPVPGEIPSPQRAGEPTPTTAP